MSQYKQARALYRALAHVEHVKGIAPTCLGLHSSEKHTVTVNDANRVSLELNSVNDHVADYAALTVHFEHLDVQVSVTKPIKPGDNRVMFVPHTEVEAA